MNQARLTIPLANGDISVIIQKKARVKRLGLRLDPAEEVAYLTAPMMATEKNIHDFLNRHVGWLEKKLSTRIAAVPFIEGNTIPVLGQSLKITYGYADSPIVERLDNTISVSGFDPIIIPGLVKDWLRDHIFHTLYDISQEHAKLVQQPIRNITIKEVKSRWGSCSHNGNLAYSWRLVFAPREVVNYGCAHEVAHLQEMNHSAKFWALVASLCPDYIKHRHWLKTNGQSLFRYGG